MTTVEKPKTYWDDQEDNNSFVPWHPGANWEPIAVGLTNPNADFTVDGKYYFTPEGEGNFEPTGYEMLDVYWPNKPDRAEFGYAIRKTNSEEIIAIIHQDNGWWWQFKLKYPAENFLSRFEHDNGWVYENLLNNTINSVMSWLLA